MNWPFIWYKNIGRTFVRFVIIHAFDGQADGRTALGSLRPRCIQCSAVHCIDVCSLTSHMTKWRRKRPVSKAVKLTISVLAAEILRWLQECRLQLVVMRRRHGNAATPAVRNQENRKKIPSTPWAYFTNGPNAAASIAPTLIRHWTCSYVISYLGL